MESLRCRLSIIKFVEEEASIWPSSSPALGGVKVLVVVIMIIRTQQAVADWVSWTANKQEKQKEASETSPPNCVPYVGCEHDL